MELQISYGYGHVAATVPVKNFMVCGIVKKTAQAQLINYFVALFMAWQQSKCGGFGGKVRLQL